MNFIRFLASWLCAVTVLMSGASDRWLVWCLDSDGGLHLEAVDESGKCHAGFEYSASSNKLNAHSLNRCHGCEDIKFISGSLQYRPSTPDASLRVPFLHYLFQPIIDPDLNGSLIRVSLTRLERHISYWYQSLHADVRALRSTISLLI